MLQLHWGDTTMAKRESLQLLHLMFDIWINWQTVGRNLAKISNGRS